MDFLSSGVKGLIRKIHHFKNEVCRKDFTGLQFSSQGEWGMRNNIFITPLMSNAMKT